MSIVTFSNVTIEFLWDKLFENLSFTIDDNSRIGLIGKNGSGKTTIFNLINGTLKPNSGQVIIAKNRILGYLTQETQLNEDLTLYETVYHADEDIVNIKNQISQLENELVSNHSDENLRQLDYLHDKMHQYDAYNYENQLELVLSNLNFPKDSWHKKVSLFSGGEKSRIQLATLLLRQLDLLLLDEPTNHLDISMIMWLEKYLIKLNKPYIIISHDRNFLDKTVNKIYEIINKNIFVTHGNFTAHLGRKETMVLEIERQYKQQQKEVKDLKDFIQRNMAGQKVLQAKSRLKKLDKIDLIQKPTDEKQIKLNFSTDKRSGEDVYILDDVSLGFPDKILAKNIDMNIRYRDKIALVGKNGCGKTTLLKALNDEILPLSGKIKKGASLSIGYYDQMHLRLNQDNTVEETIRSLIPDCTVGLLLSFGARYGFYEIDMEKKVASLSGGEKARLFLAKLIQEKPNFLILDEPTNHLDLNMISSLEEALNNYDGTILFVSHDRYFINQIATKIWYFNNNSVIEHLGEVEELFADKLFQKTEKTDGKTIKPKRKNKINPYFLQKKMDEIVEKQSLINNLKNQIETNELLFHNHAFYNDQEKVKNTRQQNYDLKQELNTQLELLDKLEDDYLEMSLEDEE